MTISKGTRPHRPRSRGRSPLAACADPASTSSSTSESESNSAAATTASYDVSKIPIVDEIAALVPDEVRSGARCVTAPPPTMRPRSSSVTIRRPLQRVGYDVDINKALAKVMESERWNHDHAEFRPSFRRWAQVRRGYLLLHDHLRTRGASRHPLTTLRWAPPTASLLATRRTSIRLIRAVRRSVCRPALRRKTTRPNCRISA